MIPASGNNSTYYKFSPSLSVQGPLSSLGIPAEHKTLCLIVSLYSLVECAIEIIAFLVGRGLFYT